MKRGEVLYELSMIRIRLEEDEKKLLSLINELPHPHSRASIRVASLRQTEQRQRLDLVLDRIMYGRE